MAAPDMEILVKKSTDPATNEETTEYEFKNAFADLSTRDQIDALYKNLTNNLGFAMDLGFAYKLTDRLTLSGSANNLGFISWKNNASGIDFPGIEDYEFDGFYVNTATDNFNDAMQKQIDALLDDILVGLEGKQINDKFTTFMSPTINLAASYNITQNSLVGLMTRTAFFGPVVRQSFHLSYYTPIIGNFLLFNTGLTYQLPSVVGANLGLIFNFGPLQVYGLIDGIPLSYGKLTLDGDEVFNGFPMPIYAKSVTARLGLNLTFGRHGARDMPMFEKGKSTWN
jgi:hypothetical protein